jgi:hypothetical protein
MHGVIVGAWLEGVVAPGGRGERLVCGVLWELGELKGFFIYILEGRVRVSLA